MTAQDRICLHAQRILTDGLEHEPQARAWAREVLELNPATDLERLARAVQADQQASLLDVERERFGDLKLDELSRGPWA